MSPPTPIAQRRDGLDYRERGDAQITHAAIRREKQEARAGGEPLSPWLLATYGLAICLGGLYFGRYSGEFRGDSLDPVSEVPVTQMAVQANKAAVVEGQMRAPLGQVIIRNLQFQPLTFEVKKGQTVEWKNADLTPHTATSASFGDSGSIEPGQSWQHTFTETGSFSYICTFHPEMKGTIIVK